MTNIDLYPLQDNYESKLSQPYDGTSSVIYVDSIPTATLPGGAKVLFTINPGTSFAQTVEVDGWSSGQLDVSSTTVEKGNGINYSTTSHGAKSPIIISDNFAYWKEIATNVNTKSDIASPVFTGSVGLPTYVDATARDAAIPTPTGKELVIVNGDIQHYNSTTAQRETADTGTPTPNASTTIAGKVEKSTPAEVTAGTSTGGTGAELFVGPAELKTVTDAINAQLATIPVASFGGDSSNGAIDGTVAETITGSNNTYIVMNYSSRAAGTAARICTVTPTGCVVHIKIKGNADFTNWTFDFNGKGAAGGAVGVAGSATTQILGPINTGGASFGGGGASSSTNGGNGQAAGGTKGGIYSLNANVLGRRLVEIACGSGGGGGNGSATGGNGGGALIIEVGGNLIVNSGSTVIRANGINGGTGAPNYGGGGGGGGTILIMYSGTLTGTVTPTVAGGTGGTGLSNNGGNGGVGEFVFTKNYMF